MKLAMLPLCGIAICISSLASAQQTQPFHKTCHMGTVGNEGCTVTVEMKLSPNTPCPGGAPEYCVKIKVSCPAGIPAGDPGEDCDAENCEYCGDVNQPICITCDGQCFQAKPKNSKTWGDVAVDCSNLKATGCNHCP